MELFRCKYNKRHNVLSHTAGSCMRLKDRHINFTLIAGPYANYGTY